MNIARHLLNFIMISLQKVDQGKATLSQLHHDLGTILRHIMTEQAGADARMILHGLEPMIPRKEFDLLREILQGHNKGKDLNFFTGKPTPVNPILKNGLFHTPQTFEDLRDYTLRHSEGERAAAITCSEMAINLCHKLVEEEIERTS